MRRFFEGIKDFIYDSIDYLIMFSIIGIVVLVIGWRINILFADKPLESPVANVDETEEIIDNSEDDIDLAENEETEEPEVEESESPSPVEQEEEKPSDIGISGEIVEVTIPSGSLPSKIGDILETKGLVADKADFISKSQEMNLDTKLKSGSFQIEIGTSLENIVKIIAK